MVTFFLPFAGISVSSGIHDYGEIFYILSFHSSEGDLYFMSALSVDFICYYKKVEYVLKPI